MEDHRSPPNGPGGGSADPPRGDGADPPRGSSLSRRALLGGGVASLAALAGCAGGRGDVMIGKRDESESTFDLASGTLRVDADYGVVTVGEADGDSVRVRVSKSGSLLSSLSSVAVTAERDGDAVVVRSSLDQGGFWRDPPDVEIDVDLPTDVLVESLDVDNGAARAADVGVVEGASIRAGNGEAAARRLGGDVELRTENGRSVAEDVAGFVAARSTNGRVTVRGCEGIDGASTTNGGVHADVTALRDDTTLRAQNGTVEAALPPDLDARVVARSENGEVHVGDAPFSPEERGGNYAAGSIGEGTHELRLETTNGEISLSRLS